MVVLLVALVVIGVLELWVFDTRLRRKRIARRLTHLAGSFIQRPSDTGIGMQMVRFLGSSDRFTRCYALETLGNVFQKVDTDKIGEQVAQKLRQTCKASLGSTDPFVRHSAASLLESMRGEAEFATSELISTLKNHPNESAGRYAAKALGYILPTSDAELNERARSVLLVISRQESLASESAATAYNHLRPPGQDIGLPRGLVP